MTCKTYCLWCFFCSSLVIEGECIIVLFCICMSYTLVVIAVVYCNHIMVGRGTVCLHVGVPVEILKAMVGDSLSRISLVMHCF